MWRKAFVGLVLGASLAAPFPARAAGPFVPRTVDLPEEQDSEPHNEPQRLVAAVLTVALGPFGAHRLYLGTGTKVPIVYGLTFGGFGILPLIDLGHILFTKDLTPYQHNGKVLMWAPTAGETTTPP